MKGRKLVVELEPRATADNEEEFIQNTGLDGAAERCPEHALEASLVTMPVQFGVTTTAQAKDTQRTPVRIISRQCLQRAAETCGPTFTPDPMTVN